MSATMQTSVEMSKTASEKLKSDPQYLLAASLQLAIEYVMNAAVIENQQRRRSANTREKIARVMACPESGYEPDAQAIELDPRPESDPEPVPREQSLEVVRYRIQEIEGKRVEE